MGNYKLKLQSKRLKSGKCQIQFFISNDNMQTHYGYLLAEAGTTLKEVVGRIETKVKTQTEMVRHSHLFNLNHRNRIRESILLFNN